MSPPHVADAERRERPDEQRLILPPHRLKDEHLELGRLPRGRLKRPVMRLAVAPPHRRQWQEVARGDDLAAAERLIPAAHGEVIVVRLPRLRPEPHPAEPMNRHAPTFRAATPVGAGMSTCRDDAAMNCLSSVLFPVPAMPAWKQFRPPLAAARTRFSGVTAYVAIGLSSGHAAEPSQCFFIVVPSWFTAGGAPLDRCRSGPTFNVADVGVSVS